MNKDSMEGSAKEDIKNSESIQSLKRFQRAAKKCPNCKAYAYGYSDHSRGEKICIACGFVQGPETTDASGVVIVPRSMTPDNSHEDEVLIDKDEYKFLTTRKKHQKIWKLQKKYEKPTTGRKTEYNYGQYKAFAEITKSNYMMNSDQLQYVNDVLDYVKVNGGLGKLHSRLSSERIILAICIFAMWRSYRFIDIKVDPYARSVGLTKAMYSKIVEQLMALDAAIMNHAQKESLT